MLALIRFIIMTAIACWAATATARPLHGQENLAAFYAAVVAARDTGRTIRIHIVGDSKVAGSGLGANLAYRLDQILGEAANGYPVSITYGGWNGQNSYYWANGKAAEFATNYPDTDLLIIDFGTNERVTVSDGGAQTIGQTRGNHLQALATIRAALPPSKLSILFLGQTPANIWSPQLQQTTEVMREVNATLASVATDTNNAFFDTLELFQRAHSEAGWMEQLPIPQYGGGNVHPGPAENYVLMGELAKLLFPIPFNRRNSPSLINGWHAWQDLGPFCPRAFLDKKTVSLDGLLMPTAGASTAALTVLFNLPAGFRPSTNRFVTAAADNDGATVTLQVMTNGDVRLGGAFTKTFISLDGISFRTD